MKNMKVTVALVVLAVGLSFAASTASARLCEYHQWPEKRCWDKAPEPVAKPMPEKIVLEGVYFDTGSATIKQESYNVLDDNARTLKRNKDVMVTVVGYTDNRGSLKLNERLSEARANSVRDYLIKEGVSSSRISSEGRGPSNPIATNSTAEGRAMNRRIELHTSR